mmetsp:Transcript_21842/g.39193  ORF Transcript_21842/g.39193 Transcript_21842/m.39193 type:complete len:87 (-) Transcript_21842:350-610(-)
MAPVARPAAFGGSDDAVNSPGSALLAHQKVEADLTAPAENPSPPKVVVMEPPDSAEAISACCQHGQVQAMAPCETAGLLLGPESAS